jgi:uncharacterized protein (TIRG00374 family)
VDHRRKQIFHVGVLAVGVLVLSVLVHELGWGGIRRAVSGTGAWFGVMAAIDLLSAFGDAFAIHAFLAPRVRVRYRTVFAAQLSGMAINRLTPGNSLGEPVKITTLARTVPTNLAVSAVVMFNITSAYVSIAVIALGVPMTVILLDLPREVEVLVWIATAVLVAAAVAIAMVVRRGAVATLIDVLAASRLISAERAARWRASIADIDARLRELGGDARTSGLRRGLIGVIASRVLNWAGTIVVLHAADIPLRPVIVVAMLSVGILVQWISSIVPLGLGVANGANYALYGLLGASPDDGNVFTLVSQLRTCVIALIGLAVMATAHAFRIDRSRPRGLPR